MRRSSEGKSQGSRPNEPIDLVDGIPDRSPKPTWWKYAVLAAVFLAWVALLVYIQIAGGLKS